MGSEGYDDYKLLLFSPILRKRKRKIGERERKRFKEIERVKERERD
jgi:hypothetical protein